MKKFEFLEGFIYLFRSYIRVYFQLIVLVREHIWHRALLMGNSMRLELTRASSLIGFQLVMGLYRGHTFFSVFTLALFIPHCYLIFDMFSLIVSVCVCWISLTVIFSLCV